MAIGGLLNRCLYCFFLASLIVLLNLAWAKLINVITEVCLSKKKIVGVTALNGSDELN